MDELVPIISIIVAILVVLSAAYFINTHGVIQQVTTTVRNSIATSTAKPVVTTTVSSGSTSGGTSLSSTTTASQVTTQPSLTVARTTARTTTSGVTAPTTSQSTVTSVSTITSTTTATSTARITISSTTVTPACSTSTVTLYIGNTLVCGTFFAVTLTNTSLVFGSIEYADLNVSYGGSVVGSVSVEANTIQKFTTNDTTLTVNAHDVFTGSSASQNWAQISLSSP